MVVDADGGDSAASKALRLKIQLDIHKPLRRGVTADLGTDKGERWCPITYEHLPDFCYKSGLIGHVDRVCSKKLEKDEQAAYSKVLSYMPPRRPLGGFGYKNQELGGMQSGGSGGSGSWRGGRSDNWSSGGKSRSDGRSWRKDSEKDSVKLIEGKKNDGEEVTSPLKDMRPSEQGSGAAKAELFPKQVVDGALRVPMKIIAWNCHRLGNGAAVRGLMNVQKEEDPDVLFLFETKMDVSRIKGFRWKLGLPNMIVKDCSGRSGGLAISWRRGINLHVRGISRMYIDAEVTKEDGFLWRLNGFYGEPEQKYLSWKALRTLNAARR
ncbi:unnamed protein product [Miscanthus lutarioriparius]|uniref:Uncharacterized protein n=1 Tax=Miscanthus lutarioriparius TaxID=422564 RepID=A0A811NXB2_9POAL|nr:unnamed protein product [Miscanthus lutarioriparius]